MEEKKLTTASPAEPETCCRHKSTPREEKDLRQLQNRLKRMMGQLGGISKMLEDNRYCGDILVQVAAVESALQSFGYLVLQKPPGNLRGGRGAEGEYQDYGGSCGADKEIEVRRDFS